MIKYITSTLLFILIGYQSYANENFTIDGDKLIYDTYETEDRIELEDYDFFKKTLLENPNIKILQLNSHGGYIEDAYEIADLIIDFEIDTQVVGECASACTIIFLAGENRSVQKGSFIGFHQGYWSGPSIKEWYDYYKEEYSWNDEFEFASWLYTDTQSSILKDMQYLIERGVDPLFAIRTLTASSDDMWYPRRKELRDSGIITK